MKRIVFVIIAACVAGTLAGCGRQAVVTVENRLPFGREAEMVGIDTAGLGFRLRAAESCVVVNEAGDTIPSQLTHDGKLIFPSGLGAGETAVFRVKPGPARVYEPKVFGRKVPERMDDFAWENDRVAFRVYGKALMAGGGPCNGIDAWYKRTGELVINKWYADEASGVSSYHDDDGQGLDDYGVNRSLGAGAMAPYTGQRLWLNGNYTTCRILDDGPLRFTFRLDYDPLEVDGTPVAERRTISLDAGSQLNRIEQCYAFGEPAPVAAGFVRRSQGEDRIVRDANYLIYCEPETSKTSGVYMGLLMPGGMERSVEDSYTVADGPGRGDYRHILAVATYRPGEPFVYYAGFGWEKWGFPSAGDFEEYLRRFSESLASPFVITVR